MRLPVLPTALLAWATAASTVQAHDVSIQRDPSGVAHITSETDEGAFFGAGYATAQDRLFQMHQLRMRAQGRLAELVGEVWNSAGTRSTVQIDIELRHIGLYKTAGQIADSLDEKTKAMLQAYADGVNQYLDELRNGLHTPSDPFPKYLPNAFTAQQVDLSDCPNVPDGTVPVWAVPDWTVQDSLACWDRFSLYFAPLPWNEAVARFDFEQDVVTMGFDDALEKALGETFVYDDQQVVNMADVDQATLDAIDAFAAANPPGPGGSVPSDPPAMSFSNVWAVADDRSASGGALLLSEPRFPVHSPGLMYEIQMKGKSFETRGLAAPGFPGFLVGYNDGVAWGVSSLGADIADILEVVRDSSCAQTPPENQYWYEGACETMETETVCVEVNPLIPTVPPSGVTALGSQEIVVRRTKFGPVVTDLVKTKPGMDTTKDYVLRRVSLWMTDRHTVQAMIRMMQATDVASLRETSKAWVSPGVNAVFADSAGDIGFSVFLAAPTRSSSAVLAGKISQPAADTSLDWQGTVPKDLLPWKVQSEGVIASANHLPAGSWYPIPLRVAVRGHTSRSWRLSQILDGPSAPAEFTMADMLAIHTDAQMAVTAGIVDLALRMRDASPSLLTFQNALTHANLLESWLQNGAQSDKDEDYFAGAFSIPIRMNGLLGPSSPLVQDYGLGTPAVITLLEQLKDRDLIADPLSPSDPLHQDLVVWINRALNVGYDKANANFGGNPAAWKTNFVANESTRTLEFLNNLDGFGSLDSIHDQGPYVLDNVNLETIQDQADQSYSMYLDMSDVAMARTVLPIGVSGDPASTHFGDEDTLWANGDFRPVHTTLSTPQVETYAVPVSHYGLGTPRVEAKFLSVEMNEAPYLGGTTTTVALSGAQPGGVAALLVGLVEDSSLQGGVTVLNNFNISSTDWPSYTATVDANGEATLPLGDIPNDPNAVGVNLYVQYLVFVPGTGGEPDTWSSSDGLVAVIQP